MQLWIRVAFTFFRSLFQSRLKPDDAIVRYYTVGPFEADLSIVNNSRYFAFMELGRCEFMLRTGALNASLRKGWYPLAASQRIRHIRPLKRFQRFSMRTKILCWDEKWIFIESVFERHGKLVAVATVKCCFRGKETIVPPAEVFKELGFVNASPPVAEHLRLWERSEELMVAQVAE